MPKAVAKLTDDVDELLACSDYPAAHGIHLRTTNPIESTFGRGAASDQDHQGAGLTCGRAGHGVQAHPGRLGLLARAQYPRLLALVRAKAKFHNGTLVERPDAPTTAQAAQATEAAA